MSSVAGAAKWFAFVAGVIVLLAVDLGVVHRRARVVRWAEALGWSLFWIALSLAFAAGLAWQCGRTAGLEFVTGYLIEKALSIDNLFVFMLVLRTFAVPAELQHRVLAWGVFGALVTRITFIGAGIALIRAFHPLLWVLGGFLAWTGIRLARSSEVAPKVADNVVVRWARRWLPVTRGYRGQAFVVREDGHWKATPLVLVVLAVESADVLFAMDSIPAIFGITLDPFIVYTSNICAVLGLRALYFLVAGLLVRFEHLKLGLAGVLVFVGAKMLCAPLFTVPVGWSLTVVAALIGLSVAASLVTEDPELTPPSGSPAPLDTPAS